MNRMKTTKIRVNQVQSHEKVEYSKLRKVIDSIKRKGLKNPIKVSKEEKIVLDGHHRLESYKLLGFRKIPVIEVDYFSKEVRVESRRGFEVAKEDIIEIGKSKYNFPPKTTRHLFDQNLVDKPDIQ